MPGFKGRAAYRTMSGGTRAVVGRVVLSPGSTLGGGASSHHCSDAISYGARHHLSSQRLGATRDKTRSNNGTRNFKSFITENAYLARSMDHESGL